MSPAPVAAASACSAAGALEPVDVGGDEVVAVVLGGVAAVVGAGGVDVFFVPQAASVSATSEATRILNMPPTMPPVD